MLIFMYLFTCLAVEGTAQYIETKITATTVVSSLPETDYRLTKPEKLFRWGLLFAVALFLTATLFFGANWLALLIAILITSAVRGLLIWQMNVSAFSSKRERLKKALKLPVFTQADTAFYFSGAHINNGAFHFHMREPDLLAVDANLENLDEMLARATSDDPMKQTREEVRLAAFGDFGRPPGEAFRETCQKLLDEATIRNKVSS